MCLQPSKVQSSLGWGSNTSDLSQFRTVNGEVATQLRLEGRKNLLGRPSQGTLLGKLKALAYLSDLLLLFLSEIRLLSEDLGNG